MVAAGIDLGGTKIEVQIFDADWSIYQKRRVDTPKTYSDLLAVLGDLIAWIDKVVGTRVPVGIGSAGLINPKTDLMFAANLPINNRPFPQDITDKVGRQMTLLNDARAFALSEAVFGAGQDHHTVVAVILGTGVGGGICVSGKLQKGPSHLSGEIGHMSASAGLVADHGLAVVQCGCGGLGCIETFISGAGLARIGAYTMGRDVTSQQVVIERSDDPLAQTAWEVWCTLTADLFRNLVLANDPDCIVIGGGLSTIPDVAVDLQTALNRASLAGHPMPPILIAQGGDASGARGAALAALQETAR